MATKYLLIAAMAFSTSAAAADCVLSGISPGGERVDSRFIAGPLPRVHEVVADAMQAVGVFLFKNTEQSVEGERTVERTKALGLPRGDEAIRTRLAPSVENGQSGVEVTVETMRRGDKKGEPKRTWSPAVLDQITCLMSLLSVEDPLRRPRISATGGAEVRVANSTQLSVRSRHFFFNTDAKPNQVIEFETASDFVLNDSIVIPAGSPVAASLKQSADITEFSQGARGLLRFMYLVLPDGTRLPLRGTVGLRGRGLGSGWVAAEAALFGAANAASTTGFGYAIPAGMVFNTEIDGEQTFRVAGATSAKRQE